MNGEPAGTYSYPPAWDTAIEVAFIPALTVAEEGPTPLPSPEVAIDLREPFQLDESVLFTSGSSVISADSNATLQLVATAAVNQLQPGQRLRVDGYVDEVGTVEFNDGLSTDRADAVVQRLTRLEPKLEGRIDPVPHGEDDLLHPSCHGDCPTNRVVVISIST